MNSLFSQLQESEEKKEGDEEDGEKKDDSIVYADLDKSAMSEGKLRHYLEFMTPSNPLFVWFLCRKPAKCDG